MSDLNAHANPTPANGQPSDAAKTTASATVPCGRCGSVEPPDADGRCLTPTCRSFRFGNSVASVHEAHAKLTEQDRTDRAAMIESLRAERGDVDVVMGERIADYATAVIQLRKVTRHLEEMGPMTQGGRRRSTVAMYDLFSGRVDRLAKDIAKPSPEDAVTVNEVKRTILRTRCARCNADLDVTTEVFVLDVD